MHCLRCQSLNSCQAIPAQQIKDECLVKDIFDLTLDTVKCSEYTIIKEEDERKSEAGIKRNSA